MSLSGLAQGILINLSMLLGFVALFSMARRWSATRLRLIPAWANGLLFGAMAVLAMLVPSVTNPGVMFDCRSGVIGAGAILGGPVCALTSVLLPCIYRLHVGGPGQVPGILEILLPAVLGSLCYWLCRLRHRVLTHRRAALYSLLVGGCSNALIGGFILVFIRQHDVLLDTDSSVLVLLNGPLSMALFASLLVSERQHTESMELHSSILQTATEGFWLVDERGHLLEVNEAYCRMSGYGGSELQSKCIADLEASMTGPEITRRIQDTATKGCQRFESTHRRKDGSLFSVEVSVQSLPDKSGRRVCFLRDITARKRAEEALRQSEAKYRELVEHANSIILRMDAIGTVTFFNEYAQRFFGFTAEEIVGRNVVGTIVPPRDQSGADQAQMVLDIARDPKRYENNENENVRKDGSRVYVAWTNKVLLDEKGACVGVLCIGYDITERRLAVEEKDRLQAQLVQAQKMEAVGRLAGGVAHDLNNMLGVVLALSDMARRGLIPESELRATFEQIQDAAQRSANLTRQLLAFARKQTIVPKALDLNEDVERMLKMLRRLLGEDVELVWRPGARLEPVFIDPTQVDQILANLCVNARDAISHNAGRICIETGMVEFDEGYCGSHVGVTPGCYVMLAVSDNGCGMDHQTLAHVFEPFFTTKGVGEGSGLGLATVYGIVRQNGGFINVYSEPGHGSSFKVHLPRHAGEAERPQTQGSAEPAGCGNETVLFVEDEPAILELGKVMLEGLGYRVLIAATPGEAVELAEEHAGEIRLLLTDVIMPEMNGRDLSTRLEALHPGLKSLFMSGYTANVIAHHGVLDEGLNFIQKPFSIRELAAKVREALEDT
jgi:PAS domain S-box-containing protein